MASYPISRRNKTHWPNENKKISLSKGCDSSLSDIARMLVQPIDNQTLRKSLLKKISKKIDYKIKKLERKHINKCVLNIRQWTLEWADFEAALNKMAKNKAPGESCIGAEVLAALVT